MHDVVTNFFYKDECVTLKTENQLVWETGKQVWFKNGKIIPVPIWSSEFTLVTATKTTEMNTLRYIVSTDKEVLY